MKKNDLILVIAFIVLLVFPTTLYWFIADHMDKTNYENRKLSEKPPLYFSNILSFPKEYEDYFNDNLPFKNEISKIRSNIMFYLFDTSSSDRVIVGKDKWLFYNSIAAEDGDSLLDYRNITTYDDEFKNKIKSKLIEANNKINNKKTNLYIMVIPNKENIYSEKMNKVITRIDNNKSRTEDLLDYLNTDIKNIIYIKNDLINKNHDTYYKNDTHWNEYGALLGVNSLMKKIDKNYVSPSITFDYKDNIGDLAKMNLLTNLNNKELKVNGYYDYIKYSCETENQLSNCESNNYIYNKSILFVGDSFRNNIIPYLAKLYKKSTFIHYDYFDKKIMDEKYDIIIYEVVERYTNNLLKIDRLYNF